MATQSIYGHPYHWEYKDKFTEDGHVEIRAWCKDRDAGTFLLRIRDYEPSCYLELPMETVEGKSFMWSKHKISEVVSYIAFVMKENAPVRCNITSKEKLYWFNATPDKDGVYHGRESLFLDLSFRSMDALRHCFNLFKKPRNIKRLNLGDIQYKVHEYKVPLYRKMCTHIGLDLAQWFQIDDVEPLNDPTQQIVTTEGIKEYVVGHQTIRPLSEAETMGWKTALRVFCYDIETYSQNHDAFPTAYYAKDVVWIITVLFQISGRPETRERVAISLADTKPSDRAQTIVVENEMQMLDAFQQLIMHYDPDLITGYNIMSYDNMYLDARLKRRCEEWRSLGRTGEASSLQSTSWESSGYGNRSIDNLKMSGRINVDMFQVISRDYRFQVYNLDFVSKHFLDRGKHPVSAKEMFRIYALSLEAKKEHSPELQKTMLTEEDNQLIDQPFGWQIASILDSLPRDQHVTEMYKKLYRNGPFHPKELFGKDLGSIYEHAIERYIRDGMEKDPTLCTEIWNRYCQRMNDEVETIDIKELYVPNWELVKILGKLPESLHQQIRRDAIGGNLEDPERYMEQYPPLHDYFRSSLVHNVDGKQEVDHDNIRPDAFKLWQRYFQLAYQHDYDDMSKCFYGTGLHIESVNETHKVIDYGLEDVELPMDLYEKLTITDVLVQYSSVCGIPAYELYTRGQQVRGFSLMYHECAVNNLVMDSRNQEDVDAKGGYVHPPVAGVHKRVYVYDFASLYPNIIITWNICYTTLVPPELADSIPDDMVNIIEWDQEETVKDEDEYDSDDDSLIPDAKKAPETYMKHYCYKFVKAEYKKGLLPNLLEKLLGERKRVRSMIGKSGDKMTDAILNSRQLAIKVIANSMYGLLTVRRNGKLPLIEGGISTTAMGRSEILRTNDMMVDDYGAKVVYNDTDSTMVTFDIADPEENFKHAKFVETDVRKKFEGTMDLELENCFDKFLVLTKKRYVSILCYMKDTYDKKGKLLGRAGDPILDKDKMYVRGVILARRDHCNWAKEIYRQLIWNCFMDKDLNHCLDTLNDHIMRLMTHQVPIRDLTFTKGLGSNYKAKGYFLKVFADELTKIGQPPRPGDRLTYVVVDPLGWDGKEKLPLGKRMRLLNMFVENQRSVVKAERISGFYYTENGISNNVGQLVYVMYKKKIDEHMAAHPDKQKNNVVYTYPSDRYLKQFMRLLKFRKKYQVDIMAIDPMTRLRPTVVHHVPTNQWYRISNLY